jgi:hypothetical protein
MRAKKAGSYSAFGNTEDPGSLPLCESLPIYKYNWATKRGVQ